MKRIPEPELMDTQEQAEAYAGADFSAPHDRFVALFKESFPGFRPRGEILDLGCGPGDICIRLARAFPACRIHGVDGSPAMLRAGRALLRKAPDVRRRIKLEHGLLPGHPLGRTFSVITSNSLLHHLHDPMVLWQAILKTARKGARIFVVDLKRARDPAHARELTRRYAAGAPPALKRDFHNSLFAAFTPDEIRAQLRRTGLGELRVSVVSDRHVMIQGIRK